MSEFVFEVAMSCGGCSGAVTKALTRHADEKKYDMKIDANLEKQTVTITLKDELKGEAYDDMQTELYEVIKKTGKKVAEPKKAQEDEAA
ncbi:Cytosolic copper metallochaperone [Coemansia helicoidea]|uniref:Cytosolic copper metallochaperone n=1 Tax=Coemansia helicoidea TaxID=1286919 RepID=A0ACC1KVW2_9FUNG|nr:Cytosolic copper metallochaperone [Coemansia helicoidea]